MIFDFKAYRLFKLSYIIAPHFQNELSFTDILSFELNI